MVRLVDVDDDDTDNFKIQLPLQLHFKCQQASLNK
jgi:hypothetical protein